MKNSWISKILNSNEKLYNILRGPNSEPPRPHPQPDTILLRFWNKNSLTEIYRNIHTLAFKVLQECSSWMSRNGAMQIFFSPNRKMFAGKFIKWEQFSVVLRGHISFNVKWVVVRRTKEFFEWNCIVKWVILFASFFLALRFFARKPEIKRKILVMSTGTCGQINFFGKNSKYEILNNLYFRPNFVFLGYYFREF